MQTKPNPLRNNFHLVPRSHWQQGCDDAKAKKPCLPPAPDNGQALMFQPARSGYMNGYRYGAATLQEEQRDAAPQH